jgi:hypothetical protein
MRSIFPTWYQTPLNPPAVIEVVILNWLAQEVPAPAELMAALICLAGWRRVEVNGFMANRDWTEAMYEPSQICKHEYRYWGGWAARERRVALLRSIAGSSQSQGTKR